MRSLHIRRGMSQREAIRCAERLGCSVEVKLNGELRFRHPLADRALVTHKERRDAASKLVYWLQRIADCVEGLRRACDRSGAA